MGIMDGLPDTKDFREAERLLGRRPTYTEYCGLTVAIEGERALDPLFVPTEGWARAWANAPEAREWTTLRNGVEYRFYPLGSGDDPLDQRWCLAFRSHDYVANAEQALKLVAEVLAPPEVKDPQDPGQMLDERSRYEVPASVAERFKEQQAAFDRLNERHGYPTTREVLGRVVGQKYATHQRTPKDQPFAQRSAFQRCDRCPYGTLCASLEVCQGPDPGKVQSLSSELPPVVWSCGQPVVWQIPLDEAYDEYTYACAEHAVCMTEDGDTAYRIEGHTVETCCFIKEEPMEEPTEVEKASPLEQALAIARADHADLTASIANTQGIVGRGDGGRELAICKTKLQEVGYWLREAQRLVARD